MKKIIILMAIIGFAFLYQHSEAVRNRVAEINFIHANPNNLSIQGEAGVLMDEESGKIIYAKNANERLYPASTTKVLTALVALEKGNLNDQVRVGNEITMRDIDESSAGLKQGDVLPLKVLLTAMLLPSGNDAARTIAVYIAKRDSGKTNMSAQEGIQYFAKLMNKKAKEIGATHSHFVNPHGLHDPNHYTTAKDLAIIARAARGNPVFREIVSEEAYKDPTFTFYNRNELVNRSSANFFQGADGIKTGFTDQAGHCLVSSANRGGKNLISVVLHSSKEGVYRDSTAMLNYGFQKEYASN
ncbi:D-alanyl-D-alanine carboxypeptidase family protein [Bacillus sp. FJAT-49736]|uniref:D-alanyl-D-alanine carboxypeptidase family protein n=1 Tax=Bacillus sp. FJAT-49736 TaxID=2833582 RepID=UPI001BCA5797|nr:D-alanyl-D-alanine carboxypeptidase family protein [Bacillus sp. FJAT-49736]MBS4174601.1 D-alanyl-D-alanine carboxypeptidase [Bacillus sp. FJAT-49736]